MMLKNIRHAVRETGRILGRHYGTAIRYARAFDQGINMVGRFAQAVAPTIDSLAGTQASTATVANCAHIHSQTAHNSIRENRCCGFSYHAILVILKLIIQKITKNIHRKLKTLIKAI